MLTADTVPMGVSSFVSGRDPVAVVVGLTNKFSSPVGVQVDQVQ